jgi:uncharacterized protein YodC (DUF2158 family)
LYFSVSFPTLSDIIIFLSMANKFKTGDVITLKTGSHTMTVKGNAFKRSAGINESIPDRYECVWYDGKKQQTAVFQEDLLKLAQ